MDVKYIGGDVPWTLPFGDHFYSPSEASMTSSHLDANDLQTIARRHGFEPFYTEPEPQSQTKTPILDEKRRWMNAGVFFGNKTIEPDAIEVHKKDFHDHHEHTFCYLCSINEHDHERTRPRHPSLRRKLIPYNNPKGLRVRSASLDHAVPDVSTAHLVSYRFIVRTDSRKNSGTRAQVFLYMYGTSNDWTSINLRSRANSSSTDGFPSGSIRTFCLKGPDIGQLHHLNVNLVGARSEKEWFLKEIEITNLNTSVTWLCEFNCWLPKNNPPVESGRVPHKPVPKPSEIRLENLSVYILEVFTGGRAFAGTDSMIDIVVRGSPQKTRRLPLTSDESNLFEQNQLDTFVIVGWDLGDLLEITINSDRSQMAADWDVKELTIRKVQPSDERQRMKVYFPLNAWLGKTTSSLKANSENYRSTDHRLRGPICYFISVKTGKNMGAGTDANVFLQIYGKAGRTTIHQLDNLGKNDFEKGATSEFTIMDIDVGKIDQIRIWHDNSGAGPGWFLDFVLIRKKYSSSRLIADTFVQRLEQFSQIYYRQARDQIKKAIEKSQKPPTTKDNQSHSSTELNPRRKYYDEDEPNQRLGSSQSILRSPTGRDRGNTQKTVRWNHEDLDSSNNVSPDRAQRMSPSQKRAKDELSNVESGHFDHQAHWISSHTFADNKWQIKSVEEKSKLLVDSSTRSQLLSDRISANSKSKVSSDEKEDDVYEFEANRWLAKDEGDKTIEAILKPKSSRLSSATTEEMKQKTADVKKKPLPPASSSDDYPRTRFDRSDDHQVKRASPRDLGRFDASPRALDPLDRSPREMTRSSPHVSGTLKRMEDPLLDKDSRSSRDMTRSSPHVFGTLKRMEDPLLDKDSRSARDMTRSSPHVSGTLKRMEDPLLDKDSRSSRDMTRSSPHVFGTLKRMEDPLLDKDSRSSRDMARSSPHVSGTPKRMEDPSLDKHSRSASSPYLKQPPSDWMLFDRDSSARNPSERPNPSRTTVAPPVHNPRSQSPQTHLGFASPLSSHRDASSRMSSEPSLRPKSALRSIPMDSPSQRTKPNPTYKSAYGVLPTDDF